MYDTDRYSVGHCQELRAVPAKPVKVVKVGKVDVEPEV
jgi:hypothetical protein